MPTCQKLYHISEPGISSTDPLKIVEHNAGDSTSDQENDTTIEKSLLSLERTQEFRGRTHLDFNEKMKNCVEVRDRKVLLVWTPPCGGSGRSEPADDGVQSAQRRHGGPDRRNVYDYLLPATRGKKKKSLGGSLEVLLGHWWRSWGLASVTPGIFRFLLRYFFR